MIGTAIIGILWLIEQTVIAVFPAFTSLPSGVSDAVSYFSGKVKGASCILPLDDIKTITEAYIAIALFLLLFRATAWFFHWRQGK